MGNDPVNAVDPTGLVVDTVLDALSLAGCVFALMRDNVFGSCDNLGANIGRCALAAAGMLVPFATAGMLRALGRMGRRAARSADGIPCGAGICPCFVAGTLVATALVVGSPALAQEPIERLEVGDRVLTVQMLGHMLGGSEPGDDESRTAVGPDWRVVEMDVSGTDDDGRFKNAHLVALRPPGWLEAQDPDGDGLFDLELPELRLRALAHVIEVRGPPEVADGPGRVVLSTIEHLADDVFALRFASLEDGEIAEVHATAPHPFWSLTRRDWVSAADLSPGESVQTARGAALLLHIEPVPGLHRVYNLEVEADHEYLVSPLALRVHNVYPDGAAGGAQVLAARFNPSRAEHIFRDAPGHVNPASAGSRARFARLFENVASNPANLRPDAVQAGLIAQQAAAAGVQAFTWTGRTGQVWVTVRNGLIENAGVNRIGEFR